MQCMKPHEHKVNIPFQQVLVRSCCPPMLCPLHWRCQSNRMVQDIVILLVEKLMSPLVTCSAGGEGFLGLARSAN
jgi:hypothetical protein